MKAENFVEVIAMELRVVEISNGDTNWVKIELAIGHSDTKETNSYENWYVN